MRVLVVEDEDALRESLRSQFAASGFTVDVAADGEEGLFAALEYPLDVAVVDLGLPKLPGLELIRRVRAARKAYPILVLTARDRWQDKVEGLQAGADDYLGKPFEARELLLRVRAILRREAWYKNRSFGGRQVFGEHWVDFENFAGEGPHGPFTLGVKECMILKLLMEKAGQVVSRADIIAKVWGGDAEPTTRTVDNFIVRIRKCMEVDPHHPRWVHTIRSVGYQFDPEGKVRKGEE